MNTNRTSTVNCPKCNYPITIDINELIKGKKFSCGKCNAVIELDSN